MTSKFYCNSANAVVIMYPTGGYGNFLYYILNQHLSGVVSYNQDNFKFSSDGNSHSVKQYVEVFRLGEYYSNKNLKNFAYNYNILDESVVSEIDNNKKFLILADMGNLGDNVQFLLKYFPQSSIIRTYAQTFDEKLITWLNCITKAYVTLQDPIYKSSCLTVGGIAKFSNKSIDNINDDDAVACVLNFFQSDFYPYGKFFKSPVIHPNVTNIAISNFFSIQGIIELCCTIGKSLNLEVVNIQQLIVTAKKFIDMQTAFDYLAHKKPDTLITQALQQWRSICDS